MDTKVFPDHYPERARQVLRAMSLTNGRGLYLLGSMSMRSQLYAGDYDGYEVARLHERTDADASEIFAREFQDAVRRVRNLADTYIGDIKAGAIWKWSVFREDAGVKNGKVSGYDARESRERLDELLRHNIISSVEHRDAEVRLVEKPTPAELLEAMSHIRFHIVRWTPAEVLKGSKQIRDGSILRLSEAFRTAGMVKMDVVSWVAQSFTDFSLIYELRNGDRVLNPTPLAISQSLKEDILALRSEGETFKSLKREFSLAKFQRDTAKVNRLTPILNSDLGRIYSVVSDLTTLIDLLSEERPSPRKVRDEVDALRVRLGNVYRLKDYLAAEPDILHDLGKALTSDHGTRLRHLTEARDNLHDLLNRAAERFVS